MSQIDRVLQEWFGCRPFAARLIARLYAAEGQFISREALAADLGINQNALRQQLCHARLAMDPGSIAGRNTVGLHLTAVGLEDCRRALADARLQAEAA